MTLNTLLPIVIILMLLTGTSISRTTPFECNRSNSNSPYYYSTANDSDWQCGDGYCIGRYYVCDGILDCLNGGDEFNCQICRGESFHCDNRRCIAITLHCNGIDECGDGSDEPRTCPGTINYNDILKNANFKNIYGSLFGYAAGVIILIFGIITAIGATIIVCACKRSCPLYKWRKRREEPPVGVIVAEPNQLYQDEAANLLSEPGDQDSDDENLIRLMATHT